MSLQFSTALRDQLLNAFNSTFPNGGQIEVWAGARPSVSDPVVGDAPILVFEFDAESFISNADGSIYLDGPIQATVSQDSEASFFLVRELDTGTVHIVGDVSDPYSGGDMTLTNIYLLEGTTVTLQTFTLYAGNA